MQVNRVNQQMDFKGAYAQIGDGWIDLLAKKDISAEAVKRVFSEAPIRKGLLLQAKEVFLNFGSFWHRQSGQSFKVVLTGDEAKSDYLTPSKFVRQYFFNKLFNDVVRFDDDLTITPAVGADFIA